MRAEIKRILIVDDSPNDVELTIATLSENNLANDVVIAEDGEEALDYLYKRGKFANEVGIPAVILLDIKMPRVNGYDATRQIKLLNKEIPIIALTAFAMTGDEEKASVAGCDGYLSKPVSKKSLIDKLAEYVTI